MTKKDQIKSSIGASFTFLVIFCLLSGPLLGQKKAPRKFKLPPELSEVSGLVVVAPDSLWWHNDGGNAADLFLTNERGEVLTKVALPEAVNQDWEDLTHDTHGRLFIGDFGDNRRNRSQLQVYGYDPETKSLDSLQFSYPDNGRFDVEAFFWHQDSLHLFTKSPIRRASLMTYHFVIPATPGRHQALLRDSLPIRKRAVTAAAIHPVTGEVALLAYYFKLRWGFLPYSAANVYYFDDYPAGHFLRGRMRSRRISCVVATQYESLDFLTAELLLVASERTLFIKPKAKQVRWKE